MDKTTVELKVAGMDCNNCAMSIAKYLERMGLEDVFVSFQTQEVRYSDPATGLKLEQIKDGIHQLGYTVVGEDAQQPWWTLERKLVISALFTLPLLLGHLLMMANLAPHWLHNGWVQLTLSCPAVLVGWWHFGGSAFRSLRGGVPNMDVLIFVGGTAAFIYSMIGLVLQNPNYYFFETAATIFTLVLLGNWLEHRAVEQTTTAIGELTQLQPEYAQRISPSGKLVKIEAKQLRKGMLLQVNEGDRIPADAKVESGFGQADEQLLTGESMPQDKSPGDELIGGSTLLQGNLQARVTAAGADSTLQQMVELVKTAQQDKPPIQQLADKISAIFVPTVLGISLITFLLGHLAFGLAAGQALMNAIAVLVISCPCAMGLATPTAVMVGVGRLAKQGVLIRGGRTVEQLAKIKQLVFDKTGTLTTGDFKITKAIYPTNEVPLANSIVLAMEQHSSHPIAASLRTELADAPQLVTPPALAVKEQKGRGLVATLDNDSYQLGSQRMLPPQLSGTDGDVFLLKNGALLAAFTLADDILPQTKTALSALQTGGRNAYLLSGDRLAKTAQVAEVLAISDYEGEQLPAQKLAHIQELKKQAPTAMIGDGINDAPSLAAADLGISLSSASQVAIQSAQVVLLNGRIDRLPVAFALAEKTVATIRQNLFWAFAYNVVAIPIAAMGYLNPMWGALFMAFSDVIIIGNSIRLKYQKVES